MASERDLVLSDQVPGLRIPGLDGLRAVAVAGVLAYHAGVSWAGGGLLGVDVFFVLSGFLITSLLLGEHGRSGRISLAGFWRRRARRLLPGLLVTLAAVAVYTRWSLSVPPSQLRGDFLSSLFYVANWHFVLADQGYFSHFGAPSPLLHMWSLAVEEQFYLVWPVVTILCLRRWGPRSVGIAAGVGALVSAGETAVLYLTGSSVSRLYYGTDTRAQELMVGALLAVALARWPAGAGGAGADQRRPGRPWAAAGLVSAGFLLFALHAVSGTGSFLYEGGFLLVALATAAVIADVTRRPGHPVGRALGLPPLRYVGRISYGLYLYHWPLFLALDHAHTGLSGVSLLAVRLAATFSAAVASFHLVEEPIRRGRLLKGWTGAGAGGVGAAAATAALLVFTASAAAASPVGASAPPAAVARLGPAPAGATVPGQPRVRAMVVGDSIGVTFTQGLEVGSTGWGVSVLNEAALGCDLDPGTTVSITGSVGPAGQGCADWGTHYAQLVDRYDPDVVAVLLGRFETADRLYAGHWVSVGSPAFDAHLRSELVQVIDILSSRGARVALLTLPYVEQTTEAPNGDPWDINLPSRTDAWNDLLRQAVAERPKVATVVDLNGILDPQGRYTNYIAGIRVRDADQEHVSTAGGEYSRAVVLPILAQLGRTHAEQRDDG